MHYIKLDNGRKKEKKIRWMNWHKQKDEFIYEENCYFATCSPIFQRAKYVQWNKPSGLLYDIEKSDRKHMINFRFS